MTRSDCLRRTVAVLLAVVVQVLAPVVAGATFTSGSTRALQVSTDQMETPVSVTGTFDCRELSNGARERLAVAVTGFVDNGPTGATYRYTIARSGTVVTTVNSAYKNRSFQSPSLVDDGIATTWTVGIMAMKGNWTGTPWTRDILCPLTGEVSGNL
jgi:hypothetical protein